MKFSISSSLVIGALVGFAVYGYDYLTSQLIWNTLIQSLPLVWICILPVFALVISAYLISRVKENEHAAPRPSALADEIVWLYHHETPFKLRSVFLKLFASIATVGLGASAGIEGVAKWIGGMVGKFFHLRTKFHHHSLKQSLMIGASAGVSAIFRAPLSGTLLAIESPYRRDLAHESLFPSLLASVVSYWIYRILSDSNSFLLRIESYTPRLSDLGFAILLGIGIGIYSRLFLRWDRKIKLFAETRFPHALTRAVFGGICLMTLAFVSFKLLDFPWTLQSGLPLAFKFFHSGFEWKWVLLLVAFKSLATLITFACGGVGGLFLPSACIGAGIGSLFDLALGTPGIFALMGCTSFIGATYKSFLFSMVFVLEMTGEPALMPPAILANGIAYWLSGSASNSPSQRYSKLF